MLSMYNVLIGTETPPAAFNTTGVALADANRIVNCTASTLTVSAALHSGRIVTLNRAAGIAVTLPAATKTGCIYLFFIGTTITSNSTVFSKGNASDVISGIATINETAGPLTTGFLSASNTNTVTLNGTTTGGILGDWLQFVDVGTNQWMFSCMMAGSGTIATPFSHA